MESDSLNVSQPPTGCETTPNFGELRETCALIGTYWDVYGRLPKIVEASFPYMVHPWAVYPYGFYPYAAWPIGPRYWGLGQNDLAPDIVVPTFLFPYSQSEIEALQKNLLEQEVQKELQKMQQRLQKLLKPFLKAAFRRGITPAQRYIFRLLLKFVRLLLSVNTEIEFGFTQTPFTPLKESLDALRI
jgi:hypothetical protein